MSSRAHVPAGQRQRIFARLHLADGLRLADGGKKPPYFWAGGQAKLCHEIPATDE
jgi:hypothetical protein